MLAFDSDMTELPAIALRIGADAAIAILHGIA
jgi:hypothetical protein